MSTCLPPITKIFVFVVCVWVFGLISALWVFRSNITLFAQILFCPIGVVQASSVIIMLVVVGLVFFLCEYWLDQAKLQYSTDIVVCIDYCIAIDISV